MKDVLTMFLGFVALSIGVLFGLNVGFAAHLFYAVVFCFSSEIPTFTAAWCAFLTMGIPPLFIIFMIVHELKKVNSHDETE